MAEEFETVELEYSEDDILYYLEDEEGTEIGFAIEEDGVEVEYYYEGFDADEYELVEEVVYFEDDDEPEPEPESEPEEPAEPVEHGYLYKMAAIVGHEGNKKRKVAEEKLDVARGKAEKHYDKAKQVATEKASKAKKAATEKAGEAKSKADEMDLGITREGIEETTADLNAIAKEGAAAAKELKEAYDDIMENFGFLVPKKVRRRLP